MKLITIKSQVLGVRDRWKRQYPNAKGEKLEILKKLKKLDLNIATPEDLEKIIGNSSWAESSRCSECDKYYNEIIELGEEPDCESATAWICKDCLQKALKLFKEKP